MFNQLYSARPRLEVWDGNVLVRDSFVLKLNPGSGIEVSPVCPGQLSNTFCNGGTLPGVKQFVYSDTISLHPSFRWKFIFKGVLGDGYNAGRSDNITNINSPTIMQIEASLDNQAGENSSPIYSTIPTPYYCINILQQYNHGATDADGDSLAFSLVPALNGSSGMNVTYIYPRTATAPLGTAAGGFLFNSVNGQMTFTPNLVQDALVVNRVSEYRNGVLIGTTEREMAFIVQNNCDGIPPVANVSSITGGILTPGNVINICVGQPNVDFTITLDNPDGDVTDITPVNVPSTATLMVSYNHTAAPVVNFSWATGGLAVGHYTFYLNIKNNHCPLVNTQTVAYTINVAYPPTMQVKQTSVTNCIHPAGIDYTINYGFAPRNIIVMESGSVVKTIIDNTAGDTVVVKDSLPPGNYTVIVRSDMLCVDSASFTISDSGSLPVSPVTVSYCRGDGSLPIVIVPIMPGATINWFNTDSTPLPGAPVVNTSSENVFSWYFIEDYRVCSSGPVPVTATVHRLPHAVLLNLPQTICYGDAIYLQATGGTQYTWEPVSDVKHDTGGYYIEVLTPVTVVVHATDEFGCKDTTSVTFSDIQDCCRFSYPNAFTPNNDGNNDGFRIVTWGNMRDYSLTIFNRWGQPVFFTADPKKAWDGTFHGEPCDIGTYYYYLKAECLTGPKEWHKGDVILIR
ncbi:gliding motility-associated C-terminal domain-containing protein [Flavipsychrobacter stenotrophus]|uniref:gliding motility-associated C-terminal domain-containing protein n=1 Tax=Flavipsychrobacter stenotrophus TaxID=2077091 RepID=UPI001374FE60|nr:gliding motility-associated C-terminal domain-containing protein [Flavipsychrobacter stenotrophus]